MSRLRTLGASQSETAERLSESYPDTPDDAALGLSLGVVLCLAFLTGVVATWLAYELWLFFHAWTCAK
jgi:hypothetical protein